MLDIDVFFEFYYDVLDAGIYELVEILFPTIKLVPTIVLYITTILYAQQIGK